jgi:putative acetyltransferase
MVALSIRPETPEDVPAVFAVNRDAFGTEVEARLVDTLRSSPGFIPALSMVAEHDGQIVGHILFSPIVIHTSGGDRSALALAPMAVAPAFQSRGIGSELVRAGLKRGRELGHERVIVVGHAEYYPRFGFRPASRWGIRAPFELADEVFMACELAPGALAGCAGVVEYPAAFDDA